MFKKIGLLSLFLIISAFGLYACADPYEDLSLTVSSSEVVLYLNTGTTTEEENLDEPSSEVITASVTGLGKDVSSDVVFSQVGNAIRITDITKDGDNTSATFVAQNAGKSVVTVNTKEGNKRQNITVTVYKTVSAIAFNSEVLAVATGSTVNLQNFITFAPADTNQTAVNFYIADENATAVATDELGNTTETSYAKIENGVLTILDKNSAPFDYVTLTNYVPVVGYSDFDATITTETKNASIIDVIDASEIELYTNTETGSVKLTQNALGQYEMILGSNITNNSNVFERELEFVMGANVAEDKNYRVTLHALDATSAGVVDVADKTNHTFRKDFDFTTDLLSSYQYNNFTISQTSVGEATLLFYVDYYNFEGVFTIPVTVKVVVKELPTSILVQTEDGSMLQDGDTISVYNQYATGVLGEYLKITANPDVDGLIYSVSPQNASGLVMKNKNGILMTAGNVAIASGDPIYFTHTYEDELPTDAQIIIAISYTLAPVSADTLGYSVYTLEFTLNVEFKIGLSEITVPDQMLINVANRTLISGENQAVLPDLILVSAENTTVPMSDAIETVKFLTFNDVNVANISGFDVNPFSNNYFSLDYNNEDNTLRVVPNSDGLALRASVQIKTFNGLIGKSYLNLFVPLAYANDTSPYVEVIDNNGVVFDMETRGYNAIIDGSNNVSIQLAMAEDGTLYNDMGEEVVGDSTTPLDITYETVSYLNLTTNSSVELNFYNYLVNTTGETPELTKIIYNSSVLITKYDSNYFAVETNPTTGAKVLRTKSLSTTTEPKYITISFTGYTALGVYVVRNFALKVDITRPLQYITVSPSTKLLYEQSSVGALNTSVSSVSLTTSTYPYVDDLENNENVSLAYHLQDQAVYSYHIKISPTAITNVNGVSENYLSYIHSYVVNYNLSQYISTDALGNIYVLFMASDIVSLSETGLVTASMQTSFYDKIAFIYKVNYNVALEDDLTDEQLQSQQYLNRETSIIADVYANPLHMQVYATVQQFYNLPLYDYTDITIDYATRVENIVVGNVTSSGLYFDTRNSRSEKTITFTILPSGATNKNLIATIGNNTVATITDGVNASGVITGTSIEISRVLAGNTILRIAAQDSYITTTQNGITTTQPTVYVEFRIQVSDGSAANPFEIRTVSQFLDIENYSSNFHYVLAQDINLSNVDFVPFTDFNGGLNGLFHYYNTGIYYQIQNTIYGFTLEKEVELANNTQGDYDDVYYGLFESLGDQATIKNLKMEDVSVNITFNKTIAQTDNQDFDASVYVGALAGVSQATIENPMIQGSVVLTTNVGNAEIANVYVGGLVGVQIATFANNELTGDIVNTSGDSTNGFNNDNLNIDMFVSLISEEELDVAQSSKKIGGVAGAIYSNATAEDLANGGAIVVRGLQVNAVVTSYYVENDINYLNTAYAGGLFGYMSGILVYDIFTTSSVSAYQFVGGVAGYATDVVASSMIVQFYETGAIGLGLTGLTATNYVGGFYGQASLVDITFSYVRSYITRTIDNANYYGNILVVNGKNNTATTDVYVGGLIGYLLDDGSGQTYTYPLNANHIASSYFNASINTNGTSEIVGNIVAGGLVGGIDNIENLLGVEDSYVNGIVNMSSSQTVETVWVDIATEDVYVGLNIEKSIADNVLTETETETLNNTRDVDDGHGGTITEIETIVTTTTTKLYGLFVGVEAVTLNESATDVGDGYTTTTTTVLEYQHFIGNTFVVEASYSIINNNLNNKRFGILHMTSSFVSLYENYIIAWYNENDIEKTSTIISNVIKTYSNNSLEEYRDNYQFSISDGTVYESVSWIMYSGLNNDYPLLMNSTKSGLLYRVLPSSIVATVVPFVDNEHTFNNMAYIKINDNKLVLFYNNQLSGTQSAYMNQYYIVQEGDDIDYTFEMYRVNSVELNVDLNASSIFQPEIDGGLTVVSDNTSIVSVLPGGILQTKGKGEVFITIASKMNPSIFTTVSVLVVGGVSEVSLHNAQDSGLDTNVIIDSTSFYTLEAYNTYSSAGLYATYAVNSNIGYYISVSEENTGSMELNNIALENGTDYVFTTLKEFNLKGVTQGNVSLTITPFIVTTVGGYGTTLVGENTTVNNAILLQEDGLIIEKTFVVNAKATDIHTNNVNNATISPQTGTDLVVTVVTSAFDQTQYEVGGLTTDNIKAILFEEIYVEVLNSQTNELLATIEDLKLGADSDGNTTEDNLLEISYLGFTYSEIVNDADQTLQLQVNFTISLQFDLEAYRTANNGNTSNLNEQHYLLVFTPSTNSDLEAQFELNIVPNSLGSIDASFYAGNEYDEGNENSFAPNEAETNYIAPGKIGLLKLYLYPEFNDAEYVELTVNDAFKDFVSYQQMVEYRDANSVVQYYTQTGYSSYLLSNNLGIRLRNLSYTNSNTENILFNGSMFVQITLSSIAPTNTNVVFTLTAYKTIEGVKTPVASSVNVELEVQPLPSISLTYNGEKTGVVAIGTDIDLTVTAYNYEGDLDLGAVVANGLNTSVEVVYNEELDKWVLSVSNNAVLGDTITVKAVAVRNINGADEYAESTITLQIVEYIINGVSLNNVSSAVYGTNSFEVLNGTNNELSVRISATYNAEAVNGTVATSVDLFGRTISGKLLSDGATEYINNWYLTNTISGVTSYTRLTPDTVYGNIFKFVRTDISSFNKISYYSINALLVDSGTYTLAFRASYYYDEYGKVQPYIEDVSGVEVYETDWIRFSLIINDNSTYDHPNPIDNLEDFINMESGVHYILMNDIDINTNNYEPMQANFASLDGNGFVINMSGLNLTSYAGQSSATTGLFESVSSGTLLKNITVNIADMLLTKSEVNTILENNLGQNENTALNLSGISNVTFGVIAGQNNGTITNAKVVAIADENYDTQNIEDKLLFVYTTQNFINSSEAIAKIGGLVGINSGSISNSYIGQDYYALMGNNESTITRVSGTGPANTHTTNFALAAGKQVGGIVYGNTGTISNTYNKSVGIVNISPIFSNTQTAGFVVSNSGTIYSAFVEGIVESGTVTNEYRATDEVYIEAKGYMGGFVYSNSGSISNSYSNITINTNSGGSGGFVYMNNASGSITNAYSAGNNHSSNSLANGLFTGVDSTNEFNNDGTYQSVYYLIQEDETENVNEPAEAIVSSGESSTDGDNPFRYPSSFNEFSFVSGNEAENGIWIMNSQHGEYGPQLINALTYNTFSYRTIVSSEVDPDNPGSVINNYSYSSGNEYGTKDNPFLINTANEVVQAVLTYTTTYYSNSSSSEVLYIFGAEHGTETDKNYLRLVNNLNFDEVVLNDILVNGLRISDVIFAGNLDGNGMSMTGISLVDLKKDQNNENYGFFNQIGLSNAQFEEFMNADGYSKEQIIKPTIKNLSMSIGSFDATNSVKVGAFAGSIYDTNLINLTLTGANNVVVQGRNLVGGFAGLIQYETTAFTMIGLQTDNVWVSASYRNFTVEDYNPVTINGVATKTVGTTVTPLTFKSFYHDGESLTALQQYSYAGAIAGVMDAQNRLDTTVPQTHELGGGIDSANKSITQLRSEEIGVMSTLSVTGGGRIIAEQVGGMFGYVGQNTHIMKASYIISARDSAISTLMGYNYAGGLIGENYGFLEKVYVEHEEELQNSYDTTIASGLSTVLGNKTLFGTNVSIAIGGLVGYTDQSVILDSYVKINVMNTRAKIAGGVAGLATRENYMSHVYVTGNVIGKYVIGGVVGLYNQSGKGVTTNRGVLNPVSVLGSDNLKLYLDYVVALNAWGTDVRTLVRNNLQEYYKKLDSTGSAYYDNYVTLMSEVGNQMPDVAELPGGLTTEENTRYNALLNGLTPSVYIGSIIGRVGLNTLISSDYTGNTNLLVASGSNGLYKALLASRQVDTIVQGTFIPTVTSSTFATTGTVLNVNASRAGTWPTASNETVTGDILRYLTVLGIELDGGDELGSQQTNLFITGNSEGSVGDYFRSWVFDEESLLDITSSSQSKVWKISEDTDVLPEYIVGVYSNYQVIDEMDELQGLLIDPNTAKQYYILKPNKDDENGVYSFTSISNYNLFTPTFKGALIGESVENEGVMVTPTIAVEFSYESGDHLSSIFGNLESATINGINFEFTIVTDNGTWSSENNTGDINSPLNSPYYGMLARESTNSILTNVNISIYSENPSGTPYASTTLQPVSTISNMGLVIGNMFNGSVSNVDVYFNTSSVLDNTSMTSVGYVGAFVAKITDSELTNLNLIGQDNSFTINTSAKEIPVLYVGGVVGYIAKNISISTLQNVNTDSYHINDSDNETNLQIIIENVNANTILYVGGLVGYAEFISIDGGAYYGELTVGSNTMYLASNVYVGGLIGFVASKSDINNVFVNVNYDAGYVRNKIDSVNAYKISVYANASVTLGGLVGQSTNTTISTPSGTNTSANGSDIWLYNNPTATSNVYVGGVIGRFIRTSDLGQSIVKTINIGDIYVVSTGAYETLQLGGLVGLASGIDLDQVYNYGDITFETQGKYYVGGLIGRITANSHISNFMVYGDLVNVNEANVQATQKTIGGVVGLVEGAEIAITNGLSVAKITGVTELKDSTLTYVNSLVVLGSGGTFENGTKTNVYAVYEFMPVFTDNMIGYADLDSLNYTYQFDYTITYTLSGVEEDYTAPVHALGDKFSGISLTSAIDLPKLTNLVAVTTIDGGNRLFATGGKLNPTTVNASSSNISSSTYQLLSGNITVSSQISDFTGVLVGVKNSGIYPVIYTTISGDALINENNGILANFAVKYLENNTMIGSSHALVINDNQLNGWVLNVVSYGEIEANTSATISFAGLVYTNGGRLINVGSSLVMSGYIHNSNTQFGGLVYTNLGYINNAYVTSVFTDETNQFKFAGLVYNNSAGYIKNSYFGGYVRNDDDSSISFGANVLLYVGTNTTYSNLVFDNNSIVKNNIPNNKLGQTTYYIAENESGWLSAIDGNLQLYTEAFQLNNFTINYGYPSIVNGVKINSMVRVGYNSNTLDISSIDYYKT